MGKSTWLRQQFGEALIIDLLSSATALRYAKDPSFLSAKVQARRKDNWVIIDEIQKVPLLLDEVHSLMENHGYKKFVLPCSSARKLKRGGANMLAGRAVTRSMFPFTSTELGFDIEPRTAMQYGLLPLSVNAPTDEM